MHTGPRTWMCARARKTTTVSSGVLHRVWCFAPCLVHCTVSGTLHRVWYIARVGVYPPRFVSLPHLSRSLPAPPQCPLSRDGALLTFYADATRAQYLLGVNPPRVGPVGTVAFLIRRLADARIQHPEAAIPALKEGMLILTVRYCARARVQHAYC